MKDAAQVKLHVIAGPTASGKTALAIELAQHLGAEIISADSQQVYRHFDIGTAKPSAAQRAAVPHHVIDVVEPFELFSAVKFQALADAAISDITRRGKPVVVVGGTGLYLRVLLHGVVAAPGGDAALREEMESFADANGNEALHQRLLAVDPVSAAKLPPADRLRIIRALEIHALTGQSASAHRAAHEFQADRYSYSLWVLQPERAALYEAINARTQAMFDAGLVDEVASLVARGFEDTAPMRSVGYVEALSVFKGSSSSEKAIADVAQRTRHFAKRQLNWFRKEKGARYLAPPYSVTQLLG